MSRKLALAASALMLSAPMALADGHAATGDAAAGEAAFNQQCVSCHIVQNDAGDLLAGRRGRQGPNLYGLPGALKASVEGFRYSPGLMSLGEGGATWDEAGFVAYVQDPTAYVREISGDDGLRSSMSWRVRSEEDAINLYAFLASLSPAE